MGLSSPLCGNFNKKNHLKLWSSEFNIKIATIRNQLRIGLPKIHDVLGPFYLKINILFAPDLDITKLIVQFQPIRESKFT